MGNLLLDLRYTLRTMRANPGFVAIAIVSLAIGIGANTAIFSIYSTIFHHDRGVREPKRLVQVCGSDVRDFGGTYPEYLDYRTATTDVFEDMIGYLPMLAVLDMGERSEMIFLEEVTGNYFEMLGVEPVLGRFFIEGEDDAPGSPLTTVLHYDTWQGSYGGDPDIVGRTVRMNGRAFTVIGVAPPEFGGMYPFTVGLWAPVTLHALFDPDDDELNVRAREGTDVYMKGRLREGVTLAQAGEAVDAVRAGLAEEYPEIYEGWQGVSVKPSRDMVVVPEFDRPVRLLSVFLMGLVGLVIVIACVNLAGILLARASARQREIGVRLAIGAGRGRLVRQMLTESVLLALLGGGVGVFVAGALVRLLVAFQPPIGLTISLDFGLNGAALLFALVLSLGTGIVFGLLPARQATNPDIVRALKGLAGSTAAGRRFGLKNLLITVQVAVSVVLLLGAGLLVRSLSNASSVEPGFDLRRGALFDVLFEFTSYEREQTATVLRNIQERLAAVPGVDEVAVASDLPLDFNSSSTRCYPIETTHPAAEDGLIAGYSEAGPGFFRAMGIPQLRGRSFSEADRQGTGPTVVVNETFAERFWPGEDPVGRQFAGFGRQRIYTVIGVVADGRYRTLGEEQQAFFWRAFHQFSDYGSASIIVRSGLPPEQLLPTIRREVQDIDPELPIFNLRTVTQFRGLMLFIPRLVGGMAAALGLLALVLAVTGLYGVIAFEAARRTREVGIRMALGARRGNVLSLILWGGIKLVLIGLVVGIPIAALAAQGLTALLFGIEPLDAVTFVGIPLLLLGITLAATLNPARRAAGVSPVEALHHE